MSSIAVVLRFIIFTASLLSSFERAIVLNYSAGGLPPIDWNRS